MQLVICQSYRRYTVLASRSVSPIRMAPIIRPFLNTTFTYSSPVHYITSFVKWSHDLCELSRDFCLTFSAAEEHLILTGGQALCVEEPQ